MSGKFNDSRAKLLPADTGLWNVRGDFMKYANQEAYEMEIEKPEEFAAIMAEDHLQAYCMARIQKFSFRAPTGSARQAG